MPCPDVKILLEGLKGSDIGAKQSEIESHLETCQECRKKYESLRKIEETLSSHFEFNPPQGGDDCPGPEVIGSYVENKLDSDENDRIAEHIEKCEACLYLTAKLRDYLQERPAPAVRTPAPLLSKARLLARPVSGGSWVKLSYGLAAAAVLVVCLVLVYRPHDGFRGAEGTDPSKEMMGALFLHNPNGTEEVHERELPVKEPLSLGPKDKFSFRVLLKRRGGWLYIYKVDSQGQFDRLFPLSELEIPSNPLKSDVYYFIPPKSTWFVLDGDLPGTETIYISFSPERNRGWEELVEKYKRAGDETSLSKLTVDLEKVAGHGRPGDKEGRACIIFKMSNSLTGWSC